MEIYKVSVTTYDWEEILGERERYFVNKTKAVNVYKRWKRRFEDIHGPRGTAVCFETVLLEQ